MINNKSNQISVFGLPLIYYHGGKWKNSQVQKTFMKMKYIDKMEIVKRKY